MRRLGRAQGLARRVAPLERGCRGRARRLDLVLRRAPRPAARPGRGARWSRRPGTAVPPRARPRGARPVPRPTLPRGVGDPVARGRPGCVGLLRLLAGRRPARAAACSQRQARAGERLGAVLEALRRRDLGGGVLALAGARHLASRGPLWPRRAPPPPPSAAASASPAAARACVQIGRPLGRLPRHVGDLDRAPRRLELVAPRLHLGVAGRERRHLGGRVGALLQLARGLLAGGQRLLRARVVARRLFGVLAGVGVVDGQARAAVGERLGVGRPPPGGAPRRAASSIVLGRALEGQRPRRAAPARCPRSAPSRRAPGGSARAAPSRPRGTAGTGPAAA